ncbi:hypothetical protein PRK78_005329 [Emydomyces testavorans]|uniref:Uncharacterized protein n=1 Tax=Emydomyces testavorans TaxID=2070801 RepID=A0AAF0IJY0_9EURO|nr:hypothetical protein PRK78_005329 [Emydomyces testavorans]
MPNPAAPPPAYDSLFPPVNNGRKKWKEHLQKITRCVKKMYLSMNGFELQNPFKYPKKNNQSSPTSQLEAIDEILAEVRELIKANQRQNSLH